ncbi:hypothetical protein ZWY2020_039844 [Hordeum vulgare]|nr:hypothetical protein ZWY2020_039844 [Hordeum vulgare]
MPWSHASWAMLDAATPPLASRSTDGLSALASSATAAVLDPATLRYELPIGVYPRASAKIRIVMKSFNNQKNNLKELAPYMHKVGLPESRSLYTVLRSAHIDKKSREQFSTHVKKVFVEKTAETRELGNLLVETASYIGGPVRCRHQFQDTPG